LKGQQKHSVVDDVVVDVARFVAGVVVAVVSVMELLSLLMLLFF